MDKYEQFDFNYRKKPGKHWKIIDEIKRERPINYWGVHGYDGHSSGAYTVINEVGPNYSAMFASIKWLDDATKKILEESSRVENNILKATAIMVVGVVTHVEFNEKGQAKVWLSDDKELWDVPNDAERLMFKNGKVERMLSRHIVAKEFYYNAPLFKNYSIGDIKTLRPGNKVKMALCFAEKHLYNNDKWWGAYFLDIKPYKYEYGDEGFANYEYLDEKYKIRGSEEFLDLYKKLSDSYGAAEQSASTKNATTQNSEGCYIATAVYGSYDCPEVWVLRRYRDYKLYKKWHGRVFIKVYYAISPYLVKYFGSTKLFKKFWKKRLDKITNNLKEQGFEDSPYNEIL